MMSSNRTISLITRTVSILERRDYIVMNEILTVKEVAKFLKTSRVQVRKMIVKSKIVCKIHQVNIGNYQSTLDFCRWQPR